MSHVVHSAILVTGMIESHLTMAYNEAKRLGLHIIGPSDPMINGYRTFIVQSNGSKDGWEEGDEDQVMRDRFEQWLITQTLPDSPVVLEWCRISYGYDVRLETIFGPGIAGDSGKESS